MLLASLPLQSVPPDSTSLNYAQHTTIVNFIWGIADDVLRDVYVRGKYRDVILPMIVIRRLDTVLEPTKQKVLDTKAFLDANELTEQDAALRLASGEAFYNASPFRLRDLKARATRAKLKADFKTYLEGFSPNVVEILDKFRFQNQLDTLLEADALGYLIEKFLDPRINLSPYPILNDDKSVKLPGLDNHSMGTVFEELIRRFNEENNEEAGEHFTPRDVVSTMADLIFLPIADRIESATYLVYDAACGTGGMLTVAEDRLYELAAEHQKEVKIHLYGQEVNPETYAITKADLLIKGEGEEADNMRYGSTLSADGFPEMQFDFMLANPPYGKSWKNDLDKMGGKKEVTDPRFVINYAGDPTYSLLPRTSDGQLLFLVNKLRKMKTGTPLGSRIAEVHNGSALFTGDAGQGESNIRRWILENDWLEAIVALPLNIFYNTGIATYIWVLSNRKEDRRKGYVQLIDATQWFKPLRKNLGNKNCELSEADRARISQEFLDFAETEQSRILHNEAFGYHKITVERPLRLRVSLLPEAMRAFQAACTTQKETELGRAVNAVLVAKGPGPHLDYGAFISEIFARAESVKSGGHFRFSTKRVKLIREYLCAVDPAAEPVLASRRMQMQASPPPVRLYGEFVNEMGEVDTYEPDSDLRDTEQVPLLEPGGIGAFFAREVLPHAPDAWIDESKTLIGYEISFTRYFYQPQPLRSLTEIAADIYALEAETDGLLHDILASEAA